MYFKKKLTCTKKLFHVYTKNMQLVIKKVVMYLKKNLENRIETQENRREKTHMEDSKTGP